MNYRKSVCERKRLLKAMKGRMDKGKKENPRKEESKRAICVLTIGKEKKSKNKTTISDTFVIRFICCIKANPHSHFADGMSFIYCNICLL